MLNDIYLDACDVAGWTVNQPNDGSRVYLEFEAPTGRNITISVSENNFYTDIYNMWIEFDVDEYVYNNTIEFYNIEGNEGSIPPIQGITREAKALEYMLNELIDELDNILIRN